MSRNDSPFGTAFEAQRRAVRTTQEAVRTGVTVQRDINGTVVDSVAPVMDVQENSAEFVRGGRPRRAGRAR